MKTPPKIKKQLRKNSTSRTRRVESVQIVHAQKPVLRHLRLVAHKHTGKIIHVRHTSHVALLLMLVIVGFFLVISQNLVQASGQVSVGVTVNGPPPSTGATIVTPLDGTTIKYINPSKIDGTCAADLFVVVYDDGVLAGSTICTHAGIFDVNVQLHQGTNVLTALNFDNLNQAGPKTPAVTVQFVPESVSVEVPAPVLPTTPVIIPGVTSGPSECDGYTPTGTLETGGQPHVQVVCVPRSIVQNEDHKIGVLVWGGTPPYAISFDWGSGDKTLLSMPAPGYKTVKVHYASSGIYNINIQLTDQTSSSTTGASAIQVTGTIAPQTFTQVVNSILSTSWFETPVPLYVIAVGLTLGFWAGDIFHRRLGAKSSPKRIKRARRV
jgi:hypothetical protein